ncbi:serine carboxypeptidase-like 17 isoform X1 [Apium graveolens]|uniref:serine carboxypeptidase-like 17 isoform X1 n=1 Tax=Apium graveolens TaxID=4045 RepID=UPI003D78FAB6
MAGTSGGVVLLSCVNILLLVLSGNGGVYSQSIIRNLPGFNGDLPFKLETGYTGTGESEDVELFYYFVESERNPKDDPLMVWIAGGPGCSSLRAFFYEIGPLSFDYSRSKAEKPVLQLNPYSWTKVSNVIYLDTPVGTGFSYAKTPHASKTSDTLSSKHVYTFLRKWLNDHPRFMNNPLYITGVSYSGIIIPIITQEIYNGNEAGNEPQMNIKGYMIGNPLTDRNIDFNSRIPYANRMALLSDQLYESAKENCQGNYITADPSNRLCARDLHEVDKCLEYVYGYQILEPSCGLVVSGTSRSNNSNVTNSHRKNLNNPLRLPRLQQPRCRGDTYEYYSIWANDKNVQRALRIREGTIKEWEACNTDHYLVGKDDTETYSYNVASSVSYHRNLTNKNCRALIFSGDHDLVVPYIGTEKWIQSLDLTVESTWAPWFVQHEVAGYRTTFSDKDYSLTFATVKGGGHAAPEFKPEECLAMVDRWFAHNPL